MMVSPAQTISDLITTNLQAGPLKGMLTLASIAFAVCTPLSQIRATWMISIGYGLSIAAIGLALQTTFTPTMGSVGFGLTTCAMFYGIRLAIYLMVREATGWKPSRRNNRSESARIKRITLALSVSILYSFMTTPVLQVLQQQQQLNISSSSSSLIIIISQLLSWSGASLAWIGAIMEAIADTHKFLVKQRQQGQTTKEKSSSSSFQGPTAGLYRLTRHPNYTGEGMVWLGMYLAGLPAFFVSTDNNMIRINMKNWPAWIAFLCSTAGVYGIVSIMRGSTRRLEDGQATRYGGQEAYDEWVQQVPAPLFPFIRNI